MEHVRGGAGPRHIHQVHQGTVVGRETDAFNKINYRKGATIIIIKEAGLKLVNFVFLCFHRYFVSKSFFKIYLSPPDYYPG